MKKLERKAACKTEAMFETGAAYRTEIASKIEAKHEAEAMRRADAARRAEAVPESLLSERDARRLRDALVPSDITKLIAMMRLECELDKQYRVYWDVRQRGTRAEIKAQQAVIDRLNQNLVQFMRHA